MVKYYHQSNAPQDDVCKESSEKYLSLIQHREGKRVEILVRDLQQAILQSIYSCRKAWCNQRASQSPILKYFRQTSFHGHKEESKKNLKIRVNIQFLLLVISKYILKQRVEHKHYLRNLTSQDQCCYNNFFAAYKESG